MAKTVLTNVLVSVFKISSTGSSSIEHGGTRTFFFLMATLALQNAYLLLR